MKKYMLSKGGSRIAYDSKGKGFPLIFLHGFCEDRTMWMDFARDLEEQYRVITIDLPGFGESSGGVEDSIEEMAENVQAVLAAHGLSECIIIGHSMGGYVGLAFAEMFGNQLKGLGLFHSHPFADEENKKKTRAKSAEFIQQRGSALFVRHIIPSLFAEKFKKQNKESIKRLVDRAAEIPSDAVISATYAMMNRKDRSVVLETLACPALFIIGDQDNAVTMSQSLAQSFMPSIANIHILRGIGHMGMYECKTETEAIVRDFVKFCLK